MRDKIINAKYFLLGAMSIVLLFVVVLFVCKDICKADEDDRITKENELVSVDISLVNSDNIDLSDTIEYEAIVDEVQVVDDGNGDKIYITDTDKHVLVFGFNNPELLLLKSGDHIIVYVEDYYKDSDVIYVTYYKQFGFLPKSE